MSLRRSSLQLTGCGSGSKARTARRQSTPRRTFCVGRNCGTAIEPRTQVTIQQLDLQGEPATDAAQTFDIATRPSLTFQGNMPVAVAEAKNLIDAGNRVVFFANSIGEVERMADVLQEYSVPYQLGLESSSRDPALTG